MSKCVNKWVRFDLLFECELSDLNTETEMVKAESPTYRVSLDGEARFMQSIETKKMKNTRRNFL